MSTAVFGPTAVPAVPVVPESTALDVSARLARACMALAGIETALVVGCLPDGEWSGAAADQAGRQRASLRSGIAQLVEIGAATAAVLGAWASSAGTAARAMAVAAREIDAARLLDGGSASPLPSLREDAAWASWRAASADYDQACSEAAHRLRGLYMQIPDRPLGVGDHVRGLVHGLWTSGVAEPGAAIWGLTGAAVTDRARWRATWSALPDAAGQIVTNPVGTVAGAIGWPAWSDRRYGEAVGTGAAIFVPWAHGFGEVAHAVPLAFSGADEFAVFGARLHGGLAEVGHTDVTAVVQGSSVTGVKFTTGAPFDAGRRSDVDVALASLDLLERARSAGVPLRAGGTRTAPLDASALARLGLAGLAEQLTEMAGRRVSFMVYDSAETALRRSPGVVIPG